MSKKKRREIPRFKTPIIETHCHLDYLQGDQLTETLDKARDVGVEKIITIAVSPDNLDTVKALANSATDIWAPRAYIRTRQSTMMTVLKAAFEKT